MTFDQNTLSEIRGFNSQQSICHTETRLSTILSNCGNILRVPEEVIQQMRKAINDDMDVLSKKLNRIIEDNYSKSGEGWEIIPKRDPAYHHNHYN